MRLLALLPMLTIGATSPVDERRFMISGFDQLRVDGPFEVEVVPGSPGAVATGSRVSLDQVSVRVDGGTMVVSTGPLGWETRGKSTDWAPRVRVSVRALRAVRITGGARVRVAEMRGGRVDMSLNGTGTLDVGSIQADDFTASLAGFGKMTLAGITARGRVRNYGEGSIDAAGLSVGDANLFSQSTGDLRIAVRFTARAVALGKGAIRIDGKPECRVSGSGPIECEGTVRRN
ncbi:GIN domain-containing protein [Sphingomonas sp. M1-B02]|uniref:GIN domain-containing protein n=1 Tax=Sphingomonas sp. M1-B02 TaxID=3114300 RepID=UPI00223F4184|nr:DUF2807 domain-containing protein [Sphingomonas sp. S6-11]UZK64990.1 DUF2807 domain-containing protein [Sphingomonas sp. S6-11]